MVKVEENKVLSVSVNYEYEVQVSDVDRQCPIIFFIGNGEPEYIDTLQLAQDIATVEELKEIALKWYGECVKENVKVTHQEPPTLAQLDLYSETAMRVEVNGVQFIIGDEIPILQILKNDEVVTDYIEAGDENQIFTLSDLERYAIKWYYKNELGMDF